MANGVWLELPPRRCLAPETRAEQRARLVRVVAADARPGARTSLGARVRARPLLAGVALVALALLLALAAPAFGLREEVRDLFALGSDDAPVAVWSLPGEPTTPPAIVAAAARESGVDPRTVRQVASAGKGRNRRMLFAGRGPDGRVWTAYGSGSVAQEFHPLAESVRSGEAIVVAVSGGGARPTVVDHVEGVGFVRSDVTRVTVVFTDGSERDVALNAWRGFGFAGVGDVLPREVRAFDESGRLVDETSVEMSPLCGGAAGPCTGLVPLDP